MKYKLLLLIISFSVVLISCKKDNQNPPAVDVTVALRQNILGNWVLTRATVEAFDASGKVVKTEDQPAQDDSSAWNFIDNSLVISNDFRGTRNYSYSITKTNNKNYIIFTNSSTDTFEIAISNGKMTWVLEGASNDPAYATARQTYYFNKK